MADAPRLIFDTNVYVSRLLLPQSISAQALRLAVDRGVLLISDELLLELAGVLARPKFDRYVSRDDRRIFVARLAQIAERIVVETRITLCRDPDDDRLLELAFDGRADFLVSGDRDVLALGSVAQATILSPADFLARMGGVVPS